MRELCIGAGLITGIVLGISIWVHDTKITSEPVCKKCGEPLMSLHENSAMGDRRVVPTQVCPKCLAYYTDTLTEVIPEVDTDDEK